MAKGALDRSGNMRQQIYRSFLGLWEGIRTPLHAEGGRLRTGWPSRQTEGEDWVNCKVWMSSILSNLQLGDKPGIRAKFFGHEWNPASLKIPVSPAEVRAASNRHISGFPLDRDEFPEAVAIFDENLFCRVPDIFYAGPFLAAKGRLAAALAKFDFGPKGGLVPFTIFKSDLRTPAKGEYFFINFDARKNTILAEHCDDVRPFYVDKATATQVWKINSIVCDGKVLLSEQCLSGADVWFEQAVFNKVFVSDTVAAELIALGYKDAFRLQECYV